MTGKEGKTRPTKMLDKLPVPSRSSSSPKPTNRNPTRVGGAANPDGHGTILMNPSSYISPQLDVTIASALLARAPLNGAGQRRREGIIVATAHYPPCLGLLILVIF